MDWVHLLQGGGATTRITLLLATYSLEVHVERCKASSTLESPNGNPVLEPLTLTTGLL